ncbi:protein of unknown function [Burkholderia multivorans]
MDYSYCVSGFFMVSLHDVAST